MVPNVYVDIFSSLFDVCFFFAYHAITSTPPDHSFHHEVYLTAKSRAWPSLWEDKNNIREREVCRLMQRNIFFCCLSLAFSLFFSYDSKRNDAIANRVTDCRHLYIHKISTDER
jgi:hypothetical protein